VATSRYRNVKVVDGKYYETVVFPTKQQLNEISTYNIRVSRFDRLDNLAFKYLGDGTYWWIISLMNDLDWAFGFEEGQILKIPVNVQDVLRLI
jgi:hypothetical protein